MEVIPELVAVSDTALFRVVIEDSLDTRFRYGWTRAVGEFVGVGPRFRAATTDTNSIRWVASSDPGIYGFSVRVDNGSRDSTAVGQSFRVSVSALSN